MNQTEIQEQVLKLLSRFAGRGAKQTALTESTTLNELDVNSARMIDIVLDLEDEFGVTIDDAKTPTLKTIGDVVNLIDSLVNEKTSSTP